MNEKMIEIRDLVKKFYIDTPNELEILKNISLTVGKGEFISIVGASGSGKSTLMNVIGALDRPTSGEYILDGAPIQNMSDLELSDIRNRKIGFVFQTFNLIPRNSALKNVELPMLYAGMGSRERREKAEDLLKLVGMEDRLDHLPNELSGGQKQRVAISRALANDPAIILADEPTGALDSVTGRMVMDLFHQIHETKGTTIVLITHNYELAEETDRIVTLKDGIIIDEQIRPKTPASIGSGCQSEERGENG
ncbi:peptide ABC transporter ATP-binding protein [Desulfitobacterium hafniense]|uniref:Peptide ABC transporter ATP-binding protein n=1 Tax=Desulfitobacterium hafniense TaxID=49338 RepID=A0A0W1JCV5_DESHA|nr:ABC transporter ATP-binding protein [Desulfitobacterium hafniense]KTE89513.1 peptide ABC transporter ATP-binding protein [Desulfitobacterium hafniense]